jgi:hypothetical protein
MQKEKLSASDALDGVVSRNNSDNISLFDIRDSLHERGFGLLMIIFSLPIIIPLPGITAVIGIPLMIFAVQMMMGFDVPWLPRWLGNKSIKRSTLATSIEKASPYLRKVERLLHARLAFVSSRTGEKIVGLFCLLSAIAITLPIPFGNALPAMAIIIMSLGLLSSDGLIILGGMTIAIVGVVITAAVGLLGSHAVMQVINSVFL